MSLFIGLGFGLFVGLFSSFLGVGGGVFIVPLLPLFMPQLSLREAIATSLCSILLVAVTNAWRFSRKGLLSQHISVFLGVSSGVLAYFMARVSSFFSEWGLYSILLAVLLLTAFRVLYEGYGSKNSQSSKVRKKTKRPFVFSGIGMASGAVSGLTGLGGGVLMGPLLLSFSDLPQEKVTPTVNGAMVLTSFFGVLGYVNGSWPSWPTWGQIHLQVVIGIFFGAYLTGSLGLKYQQMFSRKVRCGLLGFLLLLLSVKVSFSLFF